MASSPLEQYEKRFLACATGGARHTALALAGVVERWSVIVDSVHRFPGGAIWTGNEVVRSARKELWSGLRGAAPLHPVSARELDAACPHADDDGGLFWHEAAEATCASLFAAFRLAGRDMQDESPVPDVIGSFYNAIHMIACWRAFDDTREYDEDHATYSAVTESRWFRSEMAFFDELEALLRTSDSAERLADDVYAFASARRWAIEDFAEHGFWVPT